MVGREEARRDQRPTEGRAREPRSVGRAGLYDPATLQVEQSGFVSPRTLLGSAWPSDLTDEAGMWALFRTIDPAGGRQREFVAVSIHLPAGDLARVRAAEAAAVASFMDAEAIRPDGSRLPIIVVGDFNDNGALSDDAGSLRLLADHFVDAAAAATANRTGIRYSTSNGTNGSDGVDPGSPVRAAEDPSPTSRIDSVMIKDSPHLYGYQNLVRITADQTFTAAFQGSDHNMQVADLGIGDPVSAP